MQEGGISGREEIELLRNHERIAEVCCEPRDSPFRLPKRRSLSPSCSRRIVRGYEGVGDSRSGSTSFRAASPLLQLRVFRLGFLQDGNVGVGVFPQPEEVFVGGERPSAGSIGIGALHGSRLQDIGARDTEMG